MCTLGDYSCFSHVLFRQSLDPLPMHGPELGVQADDIDAPETGQATKQEVLENKDVRMSLFLILGINVSRLCCFMTMEYCVITS